MELPSGGRLATVLVKAKDEAALWLGNKTFPLRFAPEDVMDGAIGHEVYSR